MKAVDLTRPSEELIQQLRDVFGTAMRLDRKFYEFIVNQSIDACADHRDLLHRCKSEGIVAAYHPEYYRSKNTYYKWRSYAKMMDTVLSRIERQKRWHGSDTRLSVEEQLREIY